MKYNVYRVKGLCLIYYTVVYLELEVGVYSIVLSVVEPGMSSSWSGFRMMDENNGWS